MLYLTTESTTLEQPSLNGRNLEKALRETAAYKELRSRWQAGLISNPGFKNEARILATKIASELPSDVDYIGNWIRYAPSSSKEGHIPRQIGSNHVVVWLPATSRGEEAKRRAQLNTHAAAIASNPSLRYKLQQQPATYQAVALYERARLSGLTAIYDFESPV